MAESLIQPKKHLALDTDWRSAASMAALFAICGLLGTIRLFEIVRTTKPGIAITWHSWILLGLMVSSSIWGREHWFRTVSVILALGVASRILLHLLQATVETQLANAALTRVIDLMLCAGGCTGISWWFKTKVRYV